MKFEYKLTTYENKIESAAVDKEVRFVDFSDGLDPEYKEIFGAGLSHPETLNFKYRKRGPYSAFAIAMDEMNFADAAKAANLMFV